MDRVGLMDASNRLEGWKQIAAYLGRHERTARRWYQDEGLPIHRHVHQERGSVWAYENEVDEWLQGRTETPADQPNPQQHFPRRRMIVASVALVSALAAAAYLQAIRHTAVPAPDLEPLTSLPGQALAPTFSPDGRKVAFSWLSGTTDAGVYVKTIDSEPIEPIVRAGEKRHFVYGPSWSPDGSKIAYLRRITSFAGTSTATTNETWLCWVDAKGGSEFRLVRLARDEIFYANNGHLSWSADGKRILAPMADGKRRGVYWIEVNGGAPKRVTQEPGNYFAPLLSPNRKAMVYLRKQVEPHVSAHASQETLYYQRLRPNGAPQGVPQALFAEHGITSGVGWLDSGDNVVYCRQRQGVFAALGARLYRVEARFRRAAARARSRFLRLAGRLSPAPRLAHHGGRTPIG